MPQPKKERGSSGPTIFRTRTYAKTVLLQSDKFRKITYVEQERFSRDPLPASKRFELGRRQ